MRNRDFRKEGLDTVQDRNLFCNALAEKIAEANRERKGESFRFTTMEASYPGKYEDVLAFVRMETSVASLGGDTDWMPDIDTSIGMVVNQHVDGGEREWLKTYLRAGMQKTWEAMKQPETRLYTQQMINRGAMRSVLQGEVRN